jgi:hypothetical protein
VLALTLALTAPAGAFSTTTANFVDQTVAAGDCDLHASTQGFSDPDFRAHIFISSVGAFSRDIIASRYWPDGLSDGVDTSVAPTESDIQTECNLTNVAGLSISPTGGTYSAASSLTVSFAGTENDGKRYEWSAEIRAPDATSAPATVSASRTLLSPTVEITGAPATVSGDAPFTVTIQFSEAVTGFVVGDVTVGNGTASDFVAVDADTYTVVITPSGAGTVTVDVAAGVAKDVDGNPNAPAGQVAVGNTIVSETQALISDFMSERAGLITQSQPELIERLTRGGGNLDAPLGFFASGDFDNYTLGFAASLDRLDSPALDGIVTAAPGTGDAGANRAPFDVWIDGKWIHADTGSTATNFVATHFGADYLLTSDLLVGMMGELDWTDRSDPVAGSAAGGLGWLAGPYVAARLHENLYFDASLQGGQSYNHVSPVGTYSDGFNTGRWLASARFTGDFDIGAFTLSPILAARYFSETQSAYTDSLGNPIPAQTISRGSIEFGPRVSYPIDGEGVDITPGVGLIGTWDHTVDGTGTGSNTLSGRLESSLDLHLDSGATFDAKAFYDGLGIAGHSAYGASARLSVPLP